MREEDAYNAGYEAYLQGTHQGLNPFAFTSLEQFWYDGWAAAQCDEGVYVGV